MPAQVLLIAAALMPNLTLAVVCLVARGLLSAMDARARNSYVMAVVSPPERAAAASLTNVSRSLASALPPIAAGWMLDHSNFGWPLILAGSLKLMYDLLLADVPSRSAPGGASRGDLICLSRAAGRPRWR